MNFKGHVTGGLATSFVLAVTSSLVLGPQHLNITSSEVIFTVCFFMSLFPDLDTNSIPQRWFYRILLFVMPIIYFTGQIDYFFIVSFLSILPLIHKHRGWTHWKITPFIIGIATLYFYDKEKGFYFIKYGDLALNYFFFLLAVVLGHYTHLVLDSKTIKIFKNSKDHH
jgi:hypothetical protein